jgi:hypothetical protein
MLASTKTKFRQPQLFLAVIDTCEVLEDDGESVLREVKFKDGIYLILELSYVESS